VLKAKILLNNLRYSSKLIKIVKILRNKKGKIIEVKILRNKKGKIVETNVFRNKKGKIIEVKVRKKVVKIKRKKIVKVIAPRKFFFNSRLLISWAYETSIFKTKD